MAGNELELAAGSIEITRKQRDKALTLIRKHGRRIGDVKAFQRAGVLATKGQIRLAIRADEDLQEAIADARGRGTETIRDEIRRRAIEGVEEPVFGSLGGGLGAGQIGTKRVYSDTLLVMMAKTLPEYQEITRHEHTGPGGGSVEVTVEHDYGRILAGLEEIGLLRRGPAAAPVIDATADRVLSARTD